MRGKGLLVVVALAVLTTISFGLNYGSRIARAGAAVNLPALVDEVNLQPVAEENGFTVDVLAGGQTLREYAGPRRRYVEALENAEYELRIHNPLGSRVAGRIQTGYVYTYAFVMLLGLTAAVTWAMTR